MPIFRCNKCTHMAEVASDAAETTLNCPRCNNPVTVYDTIFFVSKLLEKYFVLHTAFKREQAEADNQKDSSEPAQPISLAGINLFNTDQISTDLQHGPIHDWFKTKKIQFRPNYKAVDTTGFFDEIAVEIGKNFDLLKEVIDRIRNGQRKGYPSFHINLSKRSQKDAQIIATFCRQLYDYSFVAKHFYQKPEKIVHLTLQNSSQIQNFFAGEWLEWFALMQVLEFCLERGIRFSCARNLSVVFANEDLHELDVFFILNGKTPLCIECKTGEFRQSIDKYTTLRKRLGLEKEQFIICVIGLPEVQASGLSSMYDLTFVNERGLNAQLDRLL